MCTASWNEYPLRDHLGNTHILFSDLDGDGKLTLFDDPSTEAEEVVEAYQESHYYPFGMLMEGPFAPTLDIPDNYLYNTKEFNSDFGLDWYDYGARWYDAAIGRWGAVDPLAEKYYGSSGYSYVLNSPILNVDIEGGFKIPAHLLDEYSKKYPKFTTYLKNYIKEDVLKSSTLISGLIKYSNGNLSKEDIESDLTFGNGPNIIITNLDQENFIVDGKYREENGEHNLYVDDDLVAAFEKAAANANASEKAKLALLLGVVSTVLHEYVHYGDRDNDYGGGEVEEGHEFENEVYGDEVTNRPFGPEIDISLTISVINLLKTGRYNPDDKEEPVKVDKIDPSVLPTLPEDE